MAILAVLALHSSPFFFAKMFSFGWAGVDLFFVLSGFLIGCQAYQWSRGGVSWLGVENFWIRRLWRTLPLYFLVFSAYWLVKPLFGFPFRADGWPFFFFLQNYFSPTDFVQSWSLCIEEQFYLVLPLLFFVLRLHRAPAAQWIVLLAFSALARFYVWQSYEPMSVAEVAHRIHFPTHTHLDGICVGLFLAATRDYWSAWSVRSVMALAFAGFVVLGLTFGFATPGLTDFSAVWAFATLAFGFGALIPGALLLRPRPSFGTFVVTKIALWSYGLYLWNNLIFRAAELAPMAPVWQGLAAWALTFGIAALTYYLVELRGLRLRDMVLRRRAGAK